jgi:hypothetical protein
MYCRVLQDGAPLASFNLSKVHEPFTTIYFTERLSFFLDDSLHFCSKPQQVIQGNRHSKFYENHETLLSHFVKTSEPTVAIKITLRTLKYIPHIRKIKYINSFDKTNATRIGGPVNKVLKLTVLGLFIILNFFFPLLN